MLKLVLNVDIYLLTMKRIAYLVEVGVNIAQVSHINVLNVLLDMVYMMVNVNGTEIVSKDTSYIMKEWKISSQRIIQKNIQKDRLKMEKMENIHHLKMEKFRMESLESLMEKEFV